MPGSLVIAAEDPRTSDARALVAALDGYLSALYPPEDNYLLDVEALAKPDLMFFVARFEGEAMGCAALRIDPEGYGEVKRMFVQPDIRGKGIGKALLARLETAAAARGLARLLLETGNLQLEAQGLYRSNGFADRGPFGDYSDSEASIFMEKAIPLGPAGTSA